MQTNANFVQSAKSSPSTSYPPRELNVLLHDGDALRVNGAEVRVFEQVDEEGFGGFLEGLDGLGLPEEGFADGGERLGDFADLLNARKKKR